MMFASRCVVALVLALGIAACGGTGGGETTPPPPPPPPPSVDVDAVRTVVGGFVAAQDARIGAPDVPGFAGFLDPGVFWIGSAAPEALLGREAVAADLQAIFGPMIEAGAAFGLQVSGTKIGVAPDGRSAWIAEQVSMSVTAGDQVTELPYRVTSLAVEDGGEWTIVAQHWSIGMTNEQAFGMIGAGTLPAPATVEESIGDGAQALVDRLAEGIADPNAWLASISDRADSFSFGSAPEEALDGGAAIRSVFGQQITGYQMGIARNGGLRAALSPSGTVGFLAGNLDVSFTVEGNRLTQTYRVLFVYLKGDDGAWSLVQSHFSNGWPM